MKDVMKALDRMTKKIFAYKPKPGKKKQVKLVTKKSKPNG